MSTDWLLFTLVYLLMSVSIIYPPVEFVSAGLTISSLFGKYLGSENEHFVQYHLKRTLLTILIQSLLPFIYACFLLLFSEYEQVTLSLQCFVIVSIVMPLISLCQIYLWSKNRWQNHPICKNLEKFSNANSSWISVASDMNIEYRRIDKFCMQTNSVIKIVATDNWMIKVTPYNLYCAHQSDTALIVSSSDTHKISVTNNRAEVQFINIEVKSTRPNVRSFFIRLNALDFKDLQDKWSRPIVVLPTVTFHRTLLDRFIEAFKEQVQLNEKYQTDRELELCIGCMQMESNIKLQKLCVDESSNGLLVAAGEGCATCYCRPMWCVDCMARWFASRQDETAPDTWLASKCTCPMCRAKFCIYDVSPIQRH